MEASVQEGGQTFDQALYDLYAAGRISEEQALANADSANNLRIRIKQLEIARRNPVQRKTATFADTSGIRIEGTAPGAPIRKW
jgi:Tfp pilus assembly ATPase PilU